MSERVRVAVLATVVVISYLGVVAAAVFYPQGEDAWLFALSLIGFPVVGFLILWRRPGHTMGRLVVAPVVLVGNSFWFGFLAESSSAASSIRVAAELVTEVLWYLLFLSIGLMIIYFPHSTVTGRIDRVARFLLTTMIGLVILATLFVPRTLDISLAPNPLGTDASGPFAAWLLGDDSLFLFVGIILLALVGLVVRWRKSEGIERLQYRWFGLGVVTFVVSLIVSNMSADASLANQLGFAAALLVLPTVIGVAVLRYRLYEINRVVSRTITYGIVVVVLGALFAAAVAGAAVLLPSQDSLAVAAATLLVAASFNPLRKRVQGIVDRRFNRSRYDAEQLISQFAQTLTDKADGHEITRGLLATANTVLQPSASGIWTRDRSHHPETHNQ